MRTGLFLSTLFFLLMFPASGLTATDGQEMPGSIVFLPFTISTEKPQQYLKDGLTNILASRVSNRTGLTAVHKNSATRQLALLMERGDKQALETTLTDMQADHFIIGSLTRQKTDYEILIYLFSRKRPTPANFSKTITSLGEAIPALDELSVEIANQILHKKSKKISIKKTAEPEGTSAFQTAHPDRAFKEGLYKPSAVAAATGVVEQSISVQGKTKIEGEAVALAVGDLDGDSIDDIVLLEHENVAIYHLSGTTFQHIASYPLAGYLSPHAINLGDFNSNGLQEMYISANSGNRPTSLVLEWDGTTFHALHESVPYYIRPGLNTKGEAVIIGQKGGTIAPVSPYFYQLKLTSNGLLEKQESLTFPKGFNLFDCIRVDLNQDGELEFVGIKENNQLVVLDKSGQRVWESETAFGASKTFIGDVTRDRAGDRTLLFMHSRLVAKDLNGDDRPEIIVGQNRVSTIQYVQQLRFFRGTSIKALKWDGSGLTTMWETPLSKRYTSDYQIITSTVQIGNARVYSLEHENASPLFFWKSQNATLQYMEMK